MALAGLILGLFAILPASLFAQNGLQGIIRIDVGRNDKNVSSDELRQRVWELERAVQQLQMRVFSLEMTGGQKPPISTFTTCYIKTPFDGTFSATEPTETAARAAALEKCGAKANGIHCNERNVKCGK